MTLYYGLFDVSDPQNPDRVYSAALLSRILSKHIRDGIVHGDGGELAVSASDPPAMTVKVATGTAMVQGRFCENDAALTLSVPAAGTTYARIDRVVVRLNASPGRTIDILVKKGTPAPSPVPPGLTRTPETWELSLAQIFVAAGATMVQAANITDERRDATLCGWACATYLPSSQLEITGPVDMQGNALTGLPAPSGTTDAARKGYVDEVIRGVGISQIAIDADKNWNGKSITNVNHLQAASANITSLAVSNYTLVTDPIVVWYSDPTTKTKSGRGPVVVKSVTVPAGMSGTVRVYYNLQSSSSVYNAYLHLQRNGITITSPNTTSTSFVDYTTDLTVNPGDVIAIALESDPGPANNVATNNKFEIRSAILPGTVDITPW